MSCLPNFPVRLMESPVYPFVDDYIRSHLTACLLQVCFCQPTLVFCWHCKIILEISFPFPLPPPPHTHTISVSQKLLGMGLVPLLCLAMVTPLAGGVVNKSCLYSCPLQFIKPFSMCWWPLAWCCDSGKVGFLILLSQSWGSKSFHWLIHDDSSVIFPSFLVKKWPIISHFIGST